MKGREGGHLVQSTAYTRNKGKKRFNKTRFYRYPRIIGKGNAGRAAQYGKEERRLIQRVVVVNHITQGKDGWAL